jgi:signal transduction histidine kinase
MKRRHLGIRMKLILSFLLVIVAPVMVAWIVAGVTIGSSESVDIAPSRIEWAASGPEEPLAARLRPVLPLVEEIGRAVRAGDNARAERLIQEIHLAPTRLLAFAVLDIVDARGQVVISVGPVGTAGAKAPGPIALPLPVEPGVRIVGKDSAQYVWALEGSVGDPLYGRVVFPAAGVLAELDGRAQDRRAVVSVLAGVLTFIVLVVLLSWRLSRSVLVPLRELTAATESIASGNLDFRMDPGQNDEFGRLSAAFETMRTRLRASLIRLQQNDADRKQMLASISHDLKTPLTSVRGYVEGLRDGVADNLEARKRYFSVILDKTEKLEHLIDGLFRLARLELDDSSLELEPHSSRSLFQEILRDVSRDVLAAGLRYVETDPIPDRLVRVDTRAIRQVVDNLVQNAKRYAGAAGCIRVGVSAEQHGMLVVSVADSGSGIPETDLPHVFDPFYRGDPARTGGRGEAGLGLAICRRIVEDHGGSIRAENRGGAVITFTLPVVAQA